MAVAFLNGSGLPSFLANRLIQPLAFRLYTEALVVSWYFSLTRLSNSEYEPAKQPAAIKKSSFAQNANIVRPISPQFSQYETFFILCTSK